MDRRVNDGGDVHLGPMRGCGLLEHRGEDSKTDLNGVSREFYVH